MKTSFVVLSVLALASGARAIDVTPQSFEKTVRTGDTGTLVAPRLAQAPVINGRLDDAAWTKAKRVGAFWQAGTNALATDQTLAWVGFDKDNLYVAFACQDTKVFGRAYERDNQQIWQHDAVEVYLGPERNSRRERQFILGAGGSQYDSMAGAGNYRENLLWNPQPDWEGKIHQQPWGYSAELRIPLASLVDKTKYDVGRGTVWKLKLTRLDFGDHRNVRLSSWTPIGESTADPHAAGELVFEDRNLILNGGAENTNADGTLSDWEIHTTKLQTRIEQNTVQKTEGEHSARIVIKGRKGSGEKYRLPLGVVGPSRQPVETTYVFSADVKVENPDGALLAYPVIINGSQVQQLKLAHNTGWQKIKAVITVEAGAQLDMPRLQGVPVYDNARVETGGGVIYVDNVRLEVSDLSVFATDTDSYCLTGNATGAWRMRNKSIAGTYTYTEPMTTAMEFPNSLPGTSTLEPGLYAGQIPFSAGRLTDGLTSTAVQWGMFWTGVLGHDITFDLGKEYIITRVEIIGGKIGRENLYLKSAGEPRFAQIAARMDLVDFNANKFPASDTEQVQFGDINQGARWVRIQNQQKGGGPSEIQIWGKEVGAGKAPPRKPYLQAGGARPIAAPVSEPVEYKDIPPIFPLPQEMKMGTGALALRDGMTISYEPQNSPRAKLTAEVLRDEIKENFGIKVQVAPAQNARDAVILVGEKLDSPLTANALAALKYSHDAKSVAAQGYVMAGDATRLVISGGDAQGAFYGTQALLSLTRRSPTGTWIVPAATIRDWPSMPVRYIQGRAVPSRNLIRALARFRINYYEPQYRLINQAAQFDEMAQKYFVDFVVPLDFNNLIITRDPDLVERASDEKLDSLGTGRRNANPNHPKSWEIFNGEADKWLPRFHGKFVHINWDETYMDGKGSRWNVSPESRALKLTGGGLLAHTLNRIDKKLKQYGKTIVMHDTPFIGHRLSYPGDADPAWNKALDILPKDITFLVWHPKEAAPLLKEKGFAMSYLALDEIDWRTIEMPGIYKGITAYMAESAFTASKLLEIAGVSWNTRATRPQDPQAVRVLSRFIPQWALLHEDRRLPSVFAAASDYVPLDISAAANLSRVDEIAYDGKGWTDLGPNADLRVLAPGVQEMAGVPFRIIDEKQNNGKSVVMVQNRGFLDRTMPDQTELDLKSIKAGSLIFLHCLDSRPGHNYLRRKELAGFYFMVYEDGTYAKCEIKYAVNTANWDGRPVNSGYNPRGHNMTDGQLVWQGDTTSGMKAFLYSTEWVNPQPGTAIKKIIFRAAQSVSNMNPLLLAVTATKPLVGTATPDTALRSAGKLSLAQPQGTPIDLSGGKDKDERKYIAPDGTVIETPTMDNALAEGFSWDTLEYRSYVGMVNYDSNKAARTSVLTYAFPQAKKLTGLLVTPAYRMERKTENFAPAFYDVFLDSSTDGGTTWTEQSKVLDTSPEENGPCWLTLPAGPVKMLRIRVELKSGAATGIARVQLFAQ